MRPLELWTHCLMLIDRCFLKISGLQSQELYKMRIVSNCMVLFEIVFYKVYNTVRSTLYTVHWPRLPHSGLCGARWKARTSGWVWRWHVELDVEVLARRPGSEAAFWRHFSRDKAYHGAYFQYWGVLWDYFF